MQISGYPPLVHYLFLSLLIIMRMQNRLQNLPKTWDNLPYSRWKGPTSILNQNGFNFSLHAQGMAGVQPLYRPTLLNINKIILLYTLTKSISTSMQEETQPCHVMGEEELEIQLPPPILFASKTFYFGHAQPQTIAMYFIDEVEGIRFTCKQPLKKINMNTVVTALKESDSKTVSARLKKEGKQECSLIIRVQEEYLLPIQEVLIFRGKKLGKEQKEQLATKKKGKGWVQQIKKQIVEYKGQCYKSGVMKKTGEPIFISIPLPYPTTLYSFDLFFKNMQENVVFLQLFYISGQDTKEIQVMPRQGLFVMGQINTCVIVQRKGYKEVMLKVTGRFDEAKYLVKMEGVQSSQPYKVDRLKLIKWAKIGAYFLILLAISWRLFSYDEPSTVSTL